MELYNKYRPQTTSEILGNDLAIESLKASIEHGSHVFLITGGSGCGKAQPLDMILPTPNGKRKFGDLKVGDYVYGRNGKPVKVIGVFDRGELDAYEVELSDGRKTICNNDHLWSYFTSKGNLKTSTLQELIDKGVTIKNSSGLNLHRFAIPVNSSIDFPEKNFVIDPYVIGSFIGNGCNTGRMLELSSNDEFNVSECAKLLNCDYSKNSQYNYTWAFYKKNTENERLHSDILPKELCQYSHEKRIPEEYIHCSAVQRYSLLQGLFDTDGSIQHGFRKNVTYCTTSSGLKDDVQELLRTLGFSSTVTVDNRDKNKHVCYTIHVKISNADKHLLFRSPKKLERLNEGNTHSTRKRYDRVQIVGVTNLNKKLPMRCIKVDCEDELYLCNDYIVTHNTTLARAMAHDMGCDELSIHEINASDDRGIEDIRAIKEQLRYAPIGDGKVCYILDECHSITPAAQEAMLKMLEDCPSWVYFFLCTTEPEKLLATIRDQRCPKITMKPLDDQTMFRQLKVIVHKEEVTIDSEIIKQIVSMSDGSSRKALQLLNSILYLENDDKRRQWLKEHEFGEENQDIIELCRALIGSKGWDTYMECLEKAKDDVKANPQGVKFLVMSYARSVLKKGLNIRAAAMLKAFSGVDTWRNKEYAIYEGLIDFMELTGDA